MFKTFWIGVGSNNGDHASLHNDAARFHREIGFFLGTTRDDDYSCNSRCSDSLHLNLGLAFPTPLSSTVEKLRAHVSNRVQELCGMSVSKMSIEISWLNPSSQIRKSLK